VLKKTLLMLMVTAGISAAAIIPVASAHSVASKPNGTCPGGNGGSGNYCEHHCVIPRLYGLSLRKAEQNLAIADCTLGKVKWAVSAPRNAPKIVAGNFGFFTIVRQWPFPGLIRAAGFKVNVWITIRGSA
jgi:hypothetical protein